MWRVTSIWQVFATYGGHGNVQGARLSSGVVQQPRYIQVAVSHGERETDSSPHGHTGDRRPRIVKYFNMGKGVMKVTSESKG